MHSAPPLRICHVVCAGFLQRLGTASGMAGLHWSLRQKHVSPTVAVEFCAWNDNVDGRAEWIWRRSRDADVTPAVYVYAYSWGGMTAMNFARCLGARGLGVRQMILSDPVYRDRWLLRRYTRAIWPWSVIRVPHAVGRVHWFRQELDWPCGHDLVAEEPNRANPPIIHEPTVLNLSHRYMDDAEPFRERCFEVAEMAEAA